jgi:hypothetical protein
LITIEGSREYLASAFTPNRLERIYLNRLKTKEYSPRKEENWISSNGA